MTRALEFFERCGIGPATEELLETLREQRLVGRRLREKRHRGPKFHLIDRSEDLAGGLPLDVKRQLRTFSQPRAKDPMRQIGRGLVERGDRESDRRRALPESRNLGKNVPHPMALFSPGAELPANLMIDRRLRLNEALQIE